MKLYKLTNSKMQTANGFLWELNKKYSISKDKRKPILCSEGVFHAYKSVELGLLLNPIHSRIYPEDIRIFESEGDIVIEDFGKVGCYFLTLTKEIDIPGWYRDEMILHKVRIQFAIFSSESVLHVYEGKHPNDSRPREAIEAAKQCLIEDIPIPANRASDAAYAASDASDAAYAAYDAAYAASDAADAAYAAYDAVAAAGVKRTTQIKILKYGIKLLEGGIK